MENAGSGRASPVLRKGKKKQAKDEVDRQKQAEKKKRRIEKALATSAAIRSELEKKKQKKLEELKRLDEEGAAVAAAVALHVLVDEDTDEFRQITMNPNSAKFGSSSRSSFSRGMHVGALDRPCYEKRSQGADVWPVLIAQAVSALHIADDSR